jgi:hypothetical protein
MIAEELTVDKETVRQILTENLKMKKVCAKMVQKNLSDDQKLNREEMCQNVLEKIEEDPQTFSTVSSPAMKLGSFSMTQKPNNNQCRGKQLTLQDQKKARMSKSKIKTMLVIFFNIQGIIMTWYVPPGQTVNETYYVELLTKLRGKIRRKRPEFWRNGWILHQDNAPAHNALSVRQFLAKKNKFLCFIILLTHENSLVI